jgi:DNA gyrase subunit B
LADRTIFDENASYDVDALTSRLEAIACLNKGLKIELAYQDDSGHRVEKSMLSQNGLVDYVKHLGGGTSPILKQPISISKERDGMMVEVAIQPNDGQRTTIVSFANGIRTSDGGTHETGLKAALTKVLNDYAIQWNIIKDRNKDGLRADVIQQGLIAIISVKLHDPRFEGQTKNRLSNATVEGIVRSAINEGLSGWFDANPNPGREWLKRLQAIQKARNDAQMAEELARTGQKRNGEIIDLTISKKFTPCNGSDPSENELFIVEGDSAGGSAKQARKSEFQAVLSLKGKPLNVANASLQRILENEEIRTIIKVIGTGTRHAFNYNKLRFGKIILLADADVDGSHIICLLLTLFYQETPKLIENGHVFLGCPPLYSVKYRGKAHWLLNDDARRKFLKEHPDAGNLEFKRFKGLGEMNPSELRETTMDPSRRVLKQVTLDDIAMAEQLVNDLMSRENAEARRELLAKHARQLAVAGNLDI